MTLDQSEMQETLWLTKGNQSAADFLMKWRSYVHQIDDLVDGDASGPEAIMTAFLSAAFLYSDQFYLQHLVELRQIVVNCTNAYLDSVLWERAPEEWRRSFSDHYRHFGAEMVIAIAGICGGWPHIREVSPILREICWREHHNEKGEPV